MLKNKQIKKDRIVFSQWSRKSYAVLASLKKVVNIARLSIDLCKSIQLKTSSVIPFIILTGLEEKGVADLDKNESVEIKMLVTDILSVICYNNNIYHQERNNNYLIVEPIFCSKQSMGFFHF